MGLVYLTPRTGRAVRIPQTPEALPAVGAYVEDSPYWIRRRQLGDCAISTPPWMLEAFATVAAVADLFEQALAEATANGGTAEAAQAALEQLGRDAEPLAAKGAAIAERMSDDERAQVEAYAATKFGKTRAALEAMASGQAAPDMPTAKKKPAKPAKA